MKLGELTGMPEKMHVMEELIRDDDVLSNRELSRKVRNKMIDEISDLELVVKRKELVKVLNSANGMSIEATAIYLQSTLSQWLSLKGKE